MGFFPFLPVIKILLLRCDVGSRVLQVKLGNKVALVQQVLWKLSLGVGWAGSGEPGCGCWEILGPRWLWQRGEAGRLQPRVRGRAQHAVPPTASFLFCFKAGRSLHLATEPSVRCSHAHDPRVPLCPGDYLGIFLFC